MTHADTHDPDTEAGQADADQAQAVERLLDASGEAQAREALTAAGNRAGLQHLDRILARRRAAELLKQGQPLPAAREQLMSERGLSRRTAYRVLDAAAALLGLRNTTTDPQPESPTITTTEATHNTTAEADASGASAQTETAAADAPTEAVQPEATTVAPPAAPQPMRVRITHLRAPWPEGAQPGHIVEFPAGVVPPWALGKCQTVDAATPADFVHQPPKPVAPVTVAAVNWDALTVAGTTAEARQAELELRRADLTKAEAEVAALTTKLAETRARQHAASMRLAGPVDHNTPAGVVAGAMQAQAEHDQAARESNTAEAALRSATRRAESLRAEVHRLNLQVSAPDRLAPALDARNAAAQRVKDCDADVQRLADAIARLDAELSTEETTQAETRRHAAAQLLERARTGQSLDDVATPNEGRLNALREARAGAVEAHAEAQRVASAARAERDRAEREVFAVLADQQLAEFQAAYARMLDTAGQWVAHHIKATKQAPGLPNFMGDLNKAVDRVMARLDTIAS